MSQTNDLAAIANEIEILNANLLKVNATVDLIGKPAILKANEISTTLNDAKERFSTALADQVMAERDKRLNRFSDISVEKRPGESLTSTGYIIRYTQDAWDVSLNQTVPKPHVCNGFAALADAAYEYLVTKKPDAIPAEIMALAPGNPQQAMSVYLAGKARGFFKGAVAA